jgi:hypothetical protein
MNLRHLWRPARSREHHDSHEALLKPAENGTTDSSSLDAIVVPTARSTENLRTAATIARELGLPLVALCSQRAEFEDCARLGKVVGADVTAIDIDQMPADLLPRFVTTTVLDDAGFGHRQDTPAKRNLALLLAGLMRWQRIAFLDDDVTVPDPRDLHRAAQLLDRYSAVGLSISEFPDNSVVCHAHRETGGNQRTFVGAGALVVDTTSVSSFFPQIYNEDWFFLLDGDGLSPVAVSGSAAQEEYDPYDEKRARHEEFGDCLAEGVYWLLDKGQSVRDADVDFWTEYLGIRLAFIDDVAAKVRLSKGLVAKKHRMMDALDAARARCEVISPLLCVEYLEAWRDDRRRWRWHLDERLSASPQPDRVELEKVLSNLGLLWSNFRTRT